MAFTWTAITQNVTVIDDSHYKQIVDNIDLLAGNIGIATYTWSTDLASIKAGTHQLNDVEELHLQEIRDAVDYFKHNSICSSDYGTYNNGHLSTVYATHCATNNGAENGSNNYPNCSDNSSNCSDYPSSCSTNYSSDYSPNNGTNKSECSSTKYSYDSVDKGTVNSTQCSTANSSNYNPNCTAANTDKTAEKSPNNSTNRSGVNSGNKCITGYS